MLHLRGRPARGACCHASGRVCFPMMSPVAIAVLSVSMSADAFAAAIGRGAQHRPTLPQALLSGRTEIASAIQRAHRRVAIDAENGR